MCYRIHRSTDGHEAALVRLNPPHDSADADLDVLLGSVTERIVGAASVPVLTVRATDASD